MRVLVIGNCTAAEIARCIGIMTGITVDSMLSFTTDAVGDNINSYNYIFSTPLSGIPLETKYPSIKGNIIYYPRITYTALHPDCVYAHTSDGGFLQSAMGDYNSSIVLASWMQGLTCDEAETLFCPDVFRALGFDAIDDDGTESFTWAEGPDRIGTLDLSIKWKKLGFFMHTINHPKLTVIADLSRRLLEKAAIQVSISYPEDYIVDNLMFSYIWPVYPGISERYGRIGNFDFKLIHTRSAAGGAPLILSLRDFILESYQAYSECEPTSVKCARLSDDRYSNIRSLLSGRLSAGRPRTPYSALPDQNFWKKAVSGVEVAAVDPVGKAKFLISSSTRVATAGSCFAQHIANALKRSGYLFHVTEPSPDHLSPKDAASSNYDVYSARFGNVYTSRQLVQLFDRAYGSFKPREEVWIRPNGRLSDPFRPEVEPDGFQSEADLTMDRERHLSCVRELFETLDVFVFTLGLTEAWMSRVDGAVFPIAPGVVAGTYSAEQYERLNLNVNDVTADMEAFLRRLKKVNPRAKMILTVSPVPLAATFEDHHVLVSTTYSKSVLRVAAEHVASVDHDVMYFPSYEIITGNFNRGTYYEADLRSVTKTGVEHVMGLFLKHCTAASNQRASAEIEMLQRVICEEEKLDRG